MGYIGLSGYGLQDSDFSVGNDSGFSGSTDFSIGETDSTSAIIPTPSLSLGLSQDTYGSDPSSTPIKSPSLNEMIASVNPDKKANSSSGTSGAIKDETADKFTRDTKLDYDHKKAVTKDEALKVALQNGRHFQKGVSVEDHDKDKELAREVYQAVLLRSQILGILAEKLNDDEVDVNKWLRAIRHEINTGKYDKTEADIIDQELKDLSSLVTEAIEVEKRDADGNRIPVKTNGKIKTDDQGNIVYQKEKISGVKILEYINDPAVKAALMEKIAHEQEELGNISDFNIEKTAAQRSLGRYIGLQIVDKGIVGSLRGAHSWYHGNGFTKGLLKHGTTSAKSRWLSEASTKIPTNIQPTDTIKKVVDEMLTGKPAGIAGKVINKEKIASQVSQKVVKEMGEQTIEAFGRKAAAEAVEAAGKKAGKALTKNAAKKLTTKVIGEAGEQVAKIAAKKIAAKATGAMAARLASLGAGPVGVAINIGFLAWDVREFIMDYRKNGVSKDSESLIGMGLYWAGKGLNSLSGDLLGIGKWGFLPA